MASRINTRSVLIIGTGIWMCFAGPLRAVETAHASYGQSAEAESASASGRAAKPTKYARRSWKKHAAHRKFKRIAWKSSRKTLEAPKLDDGGASDALPADVANANARYASADMPTTSAGGLTSQAGALPQAFGAAATDETTPDGAGTPLVSADQLNDVDRALTENKASPPLLAMAAASTAPAIGAPIMASGSSEDNAWGKSSIIGKIFIAFGGLLTLASAARMFMA